MEECAVLSLPFSSLSLSFSSLSLSPLRDMEEGMCEGEGMREEDEGGGRGKKRDAGCARKLLCLFSDVGRVHERERE